MDDDLVARLLALLPDHRGVLGRLALLDHGGAVTVAVTVTMLADGDAGANRAHAHANPGLFSIRRRDRQRDTGHGCQCSSFAQAYDTLADLIRFGIPEYQREGFDIPAELER